MFATDFLITFRNRDRPIGSTTDGAERSSRHTLASRRHRFAGDILTDAASFTFIRVVTLVGQSPGHHRPARQHWDNCPPRRATGATAAAAYAFVPNSEIASLLPRYQTRRALLSQGPEEATPSRPILTGNDILRQQLFPGSACGRMPYCPHCPYIRTRCGDGHACDLSDDVGGDAVTELLQLQHNIPSSTSKSKHNRRKLMLVSSSSSRTATCSANVAHRCTIARW